MKRLFATVFAAALTSSVAMAETLTITAVKLASPEMIVLSMQKHFPEVAKRHGINNGKLEIQYSRGSVEALTNLITGKSHINIASLPTIVKLHKESPGRLQFISMFNTSDAPLVCKPYVKDIKDIKDNKRSIIISGKQSGSHLLIQKLARDNFGDPLALENQIVLLSQVQTLQAFASGTKGIDCAIQGAPISNQLREMGNKVLYPGPTGFLNSAVINAQWAKDNPKLALALLDTIKVAQKEYTDNMPVLAQAMVERHNLKDLDADTIVRYYKQMNIVALTKFTPAVIDWLHLTEEMGMLPAGSMKAFDSSIIWREDLL